MSENIYKALAEISRESSAIGKESKNQSQGFMFRGIDAVMNALHPVFAKHEVIIMPEVLDERSEERQTKSGNNLIYRILRIKFTFWHSSGTSVSCTMLGEGMDSGDKAANKAQAVALKYALTQMQLLPYDEVDPDGESHQVVSKTKTEVKTSTKLSPIPPAKASTEPEDEKYLKFKAWCMKLEDEHPGHLLNQLESWGLKSLSDVPEARRNEFYKMLELMCKPKKTV